MADTPEIIFPGWLDVDLHDGFAFEGRRHTQVSDLYSWSGQRRGVYNSGGVICRPDRQFISVIRIGPKLDYFALSWTRKGDIQPPSGIQETRRIRRSVAHHVVRQHGRLTIAIRKLFAVDQ